ncbi:MAG: hypothetical protein KAH05_00645, partial [Clostridiales bacterium]|nr:hypothetical protein [Clostridiales bacterium]
MNPPVSSNEPTKINIEIKKNKVGHSTSSKTSSGLILLINNKSDAPKRATVANSNPNYACKTNSN